MRSVQFCEVIRLRVEPELRDAIEAAALEEKTSASEFVRRGLRSFMRSRGDAPDRDPPPLPAGPAAALRAAA